MSLINNICNSSAMFQTLSSNSGSDFFSKLSQNWIWIVIAVGILFFLFLYVTLICLVMGGKKEEEVIKDNKNQNENANNLKREGVDYSNLLNSQNLSFGQPSNDTLFNLFLKTHDDVRDIKNQLEFSEKTEAAAKQDAQFKAISEEIEKKFEKTEALIAEQKEESLKKEIESQERELQELRQKIFTEKNIDQNNVKQEDSLESLKKNETLINEENIEKQASVSDNEKKKRLEKRTDINYEVLDNENVLELFEEQDGTLVSKDAVVIEGVQRFTIQEAYNQLSTTQKGYFDKLKNYASSKPNAKIKEAKSYVSIGDGNKNYIQLTIKKNTVIACFSLESEDLLRLRLEGETSIKPEKTKVKIVDLETLDSAIKMIDIRAMQVKKEIELIKDLRKEKQKIRYESLKNKK